MKQKSVIISSLLFICLALVFLSRNSKEDESSDNNSNKFSDIILDTYIDREELDSAINYIDNIYKENPDDIDILIARADTYYEANQAHISRDCWEHCLEIDSDNIICSENLVELYCSIGDLNCENNIDYLLELDSENLIALYFKAKLNKDLGKNELAIQIYHEILDIKPDHLGALEDLALLYTYQNDEMAIQYFEKLLEEKETYQVYYNYGYYFQLQEDFLNAIEKYEFSISLNENWPYSYYSMGYCYLASAFSSKDELENKELLQKALNIFDKTISLDGGYLEAYHGRGLCYQELGNKKAAMEDFKFCLMIEPGYEPAMNGISDLEKSQ